MQNNQPITKPTHEIRGVVFDLDGTLLDTLDDLADSANIALESFGMPTHPVDDYRYHIGDGVRILAQRILPEDRADDSTIDDFLAVYKQEYTNRWDQKSRPYDGIAAMLDQLKSRGLKLGVLSNKPQAFTEKCAAKLLANWPFDVVVGQRDGVPHKPDPTGAFSILKDWGLLNTEVLYVGDTGTDMQTGRSAGMFSVGVLWGFREREELVENGADTVIDHPQQLLELLS